jgi:DNA-binding transcriptional ArsR family regulator
VTIEVGQVLAALADDTRRGIVTLLASGATPTATELAADLPISRQAVAKHLRTLEQAQLITVERAGRETRYHLTDRPFDELARRAQHHLDRRLERLRAHAERETEMT